MTTEQQSVDEARVAANVATWPRLSDERKAELRRLLLPSADRLRRDAEREEDAR